MDALKRAGHNLVVVPQVLYEFWAVATRPPGENGLGLTTAQAHADLVALKSLFTLFNDPPDLYQEWERLVQQFDVKGKTAHDARLVAAMTLLAVPAILTFNTKDFARFAGISVLDPAVVAATPP